MERGYITGIAGLRALAVLSVVAFHINSHWLPGGFVGVDLFFVISGFVVAHSVIGTRHDGFLPFFAWFYRRRFQRILPAAFLYIFVATVAALIFVPRVSATKFLEPTGIAAIFGLSNIMLFLKAGDYFAVTSDFNLFTHTWSLAVEEQYYVIFPFFAYLILVAGERFPRARIVAIWVVAGLCVLSLAAAAILSVKAPSFAFYMLPTRFWQLGMGFFLRLFLTTRAADRLASGLRGVAPPLGVAALAGLAISFWFTDEKAFPFPGALLPCLSTALLLWVLWSYPGSAVDRLLSLRPFVWFGNISYSLYLWHWGVIVLMRWTIGIDTVPLQLFAAAVMIALAWLSYAYVEQFFHGRKSKGGKPHPVFLRFGAVAGGLALLAGASYMAKPRYGIAKANDVVAWDPAVAPDMPAGCEADKKLASVGPGLHVRLTSKCKKAGARQIFVVGDSHAGAYMRSMLRIAASGEFEPHILTLGGCRMVNVTPVEPIKGCPQFIDAAIERIRSLARPGDVIFLAGLHTPRYPSAESAAPSPLGLRLDERAIAASQARLRTLASLGAKVVVEGPKPVMPYPLYRCADAFNRGNPDCRVPPAITPTDIRHRMETPLAGLKRVTDAVDGVVFFEPAKLLCDPVQCPAYKDGKPLYYDNDHLSGYGNDLLLPKLLEQFRA